MERFCSRLFIAAQPHGPQRIGVQPDADLLYAYVDPTLFALQKHETQKFNGKLFQLTMPMKLHGLVVIVTTLENMDLRPLSISPRNLMRMLLIDILPATTKFSGQHDLHRSQLALNWTLLFRRL
jgi:hypothetical protein